ncbi:MAG: MAPEG family protein [Rhodobacter sp.]|nr:MAPEG family protein [Rhodobacter sp.]MCA3462524.1 MAPEG family protein [Rhodobacter sp.]MCA3463327.1 MAPEG family protein [Rhodobacter sp.]MCA3467707.1 MAPEG family protein [Rhodobacter sp.]MCA3472132.1 MAPEG family protein [Rhodobacter sp.]
MPPVITPLYAAALTALFITLSLRVIALRRSGRVLLGDAGNPALLARIRAQGNCAEYVPLGIVLLLLAELAGTAPALLLHLSGLLLLAGRLCHAWALSGPGRLGARTIGMLMTFTALALSAALALPWAAIF